MIIDGSFNECIINGMKTMDCRINKGPTAKIQAGDRVYIFGGKHILLVEITAVEYYSDFEQALSDKDIMKICPQMDLQQALEYYRNQFSREDEKKYGVVCLMFKMT